MNAEIYDLIFTIIHLAKSENSPPISQIERIAEKLVAENAIDVCFEYPDVLIQLYDLSEKSEIVVRCVVKLLRSAIEKSENFAQLRQIAELFIALSDLPINEKTEIEKMLIRNLTPFIRPGPHVDETINLFHWLCAQMTIGGSEIMIANLSKLLLTEARFPISTVEAIIDLVFTHVKLHPLDEVCTIQFFYVVERENSFQRLFSLILEKIWEKTTPLFRELFIEKIENEIASMRLDDLDEVHKVLVELIRQRATPEHEKTQLSLVKKLLVITQTPDRLTKLWSMLRPESGSLVDVLLDRSLTAIILWLIFVPIADEIPNSKISLMLKNRELPPNQVGLQQRSILVVFDHLISTNRQPSFSIQIRRVFLNAIAQLISIDSEKSHLLIDSLKIYLDGISESEQIEWLKMMKTVWQTDAIRGTADVDRISKRTQNRLDLLWETHFANRARGRDKKFWHI